MCKGESVEIEVKFPAADGTERGARAGGIGRGFPDSHDAQFRPPQITPLAAQVTWQF